MYEKHDHAENYRIYDRHRPKLQRRKPGLLVLAVTFHELLNAVPAPTSCLPLPIRRRPHSLAFAHCVLVTAQYFSDFLSCKWPLDGDLSIHSYCF